MALRLYSPQDNPKTNKVLVVAALSNTQLELVNTPYDQLKKKEFLQKNPFGKIPMLQTDQGNVFESNAILRHLARLNQDAKLYGNNPQEMGLVDQWLDFTILEFESLVMSLVIPLLGHYPFEQGVQKKAHHELSDKLKILDQYLNNKTWFVGNQVTIADVALGTAITPLFQFYLDEKARKGYANLLKWYENLTNLKEWRTYFGRPRLCKKQLPAPKEEKSDEKKEDKKDKKDKKDDKKDKKKEEKQDKKDKKDKKEKKEEKQEEKKEDDVPKKKENPLDLLPPSPFNIDDYKRKFFADKDIGATVDYLFENLDYNGWSLWFIKYDKAENEGKQILKTNNTMKGFLQRIDPSFKKYSFAMWGVYGDEPNLEIQGAWLWRGTDIPNEMKDHPSFEFHKFRKVDKDNAQDKQLFKDYWVNQTEDESKVDGLTARALVYWR